MDSLNHPSNSGPGAGAGGAADSLSSSEMPLTIHSSGSSKFALASLIVLSVLIIPCIYVWVISKKRKGKKNT